MAKKSLYESATSVFYLDRNVPATSFVGQDFGEESGITPRESPVQTNIITTNYIVSGCERMEFHVISYTGQGILPESTIVNNDTPECWYINSQTTDPADVGIITYVWPTLGDCETCINSHTPTTTSTTTTTTTI